MRKILQALSALTWICLPVLAHAQTKYPDWSSNGPALIGAKNGIAPLDSNGNYGGVVTGETGASSISIPKGVTRTLLDKLTSDFDPLDYGADMTKSGGGYWHYH